jgi:hypothetical protein
MKAFCCGSSRSVLVGLVLVAATAIPTTAAAAAATHFRVDSPASAAADTPVTVTVTALDAGDSTDSVYSGMGHFTSSDAQAELPADATLTNGVGTFSATLKTVGSQTITVSDLTVTIGGDTGTFTLTFNGQTTSSSPFNTSALQVQNSLDNLSSIGGVGGFVTVTQASNVYTIVFGGALSGPQSMTGNGSGGAVVSIDSISGTSDSIDVSAATPVKLQEFDVE